MKHKYSSYNKRRVLVDSPAKSPKMWILYTICSIHLTDLKIKTQKNIDPSWNVEKNLGLLLVEKVLFLSWRPKWRPNTLRLWERLFIMKPIIFQIQVSFHSLPRWKFGQKQMKKILPWVKNMEEITDTYIRC